jgi:hypothetical protein
MTQFVRSLKPEDFTDVRRAGLQQARSGMLNTYYGALQVSGDVSVTESYRTKIFQVLAEVAPQFASILPPQPRKQIAALAASGLATASPLLKSSLQKIVAGMNDPRCEGLCAW